VHDFAREVNLTTEEWLAGVDFINEAGKMSDEKRNEGILLCDVIGVESLVDSITNDLLEKGTVTASAILGPFYRTDAPIKENGESVIQEAMGGDVAWVHGKVTNSKGQPIKGALLDVWHDGPNGLYEQQDPDQPEYNFRGRFYTEADGSFNFYCLKPTSYPIPYDGPAGKLLQIMDRHPMRPSHIHLIVSGPGHKTLTTQIFSRDDEYITSDSVFAVKEELIVDYSPASEAAKKGKGAKGHDVKWELKYDIQLIEM